jgi:hypothetical protein
MVKKKRGLRQCGMGMLCIERIRGTADPSTALLTTKRRVGVSSGNWFEGSQVSKARPGPSFDFTLRSCRGHMLCHFSPDSQTASRMLLMTQAEHDRSGAAPTALGFSSGSISQPFRAGLTFGGRPSGPYVYGDLCRVISLPTRLSESAAPTARRGRRDDKRRAVLPWEAVVAKTYQRG